MKESFVTSKYGTLNYYFLVGKKYNFILNYKGLSAICCHGDTKLAAFKLNFPSWWI